MRGRVVFLLEEPSMRALLEGLLPRLFVGWKKGEHFLCIEHQGKSDLDKSVPRKLKNWQYPGDRFVVMRDNDNADCRQVKARYVELCADSGRGDTLIRLVCQELESWYLGDLRALAQCYGAPKIDSPALRKKFADPDGCQKPSMEIARRLPGFQKGSAARDMAAHLTPEHNRSRSFQTFVAGLRHVAFEMGWHPS